MHARVLDLLVLDLDAHVLLLEQHRLLLELLVRLLELLLLLLEQLLGRLQRLRLLLELGVRLLQLLLLRLELLGRAPAARPSVAATARATPRCACSAWMTLMTMPSDSMSWSRNAWCVCAERPERRQLDHGHAPGPRTRPAERGCCSARIRRGRTRSGRSRRAPPSAGSTSARARPGRRAPRRGGSGSRRSSAACTRSWR